MTIETVRKIAASTALRPYEGRHRFIIVDEAETLGEPAQQALLKTLEDLPGYATIILIATSAGAMLDTVRSRCVEIALQLVPTAEIVAAIDGPDAHAIAARAAGRPGWAIKALAEPDWRASQSEGIERLESWLRMSTAERLVEAYQRGDRFMKERKQAFQDLDRVQLIWRDIVLTSADLDQFAFDAERARGLMARSSAGMSDWYRALTATRQCIQDLTGNIRPATRNASNGESMADPITNPTTHQSAADDPQAMIENARMKARQRFKERLDSGLPVAGCECESENGASDGPSARVAGVRFLDSGQTYFFDPGTFEIENGDWVVVETNRGLEAGKVVIAPSQMLQASLSGNLKPVSRILGEPEIERMHALKREAAKAVKTFGAKIREHNLPMKPISAEYNFDGSHLTLNFTAPERVDFRDLARDLGASIPLPSRVAPGRTPRRGSTAWRRRALWTDAVLRVVAAGISGSLDEHGQDAGSAAQSEQGLRRLRPLAVLPVV